MEAGFGDDFQEVAVLQSIYGDDLKVDRSSDEKCCSYSRFLSDVILCSSF